MKHRVGSLPLAFPVTILLLPGSSPPLTPEQVTTEGARGSKLEDAAIALKIETAYLFHPRHNKLEVRG